MISLELCDQDVLDIEEALDSPESSDRSKRKLLAITMHHEGASHGFIARCLRISAGTLTSYLKKYRDGGLGSVLECRYYRPSSALEPFMACLKCSFLAKPAAGAKEAVARIEKLTGIRLSESQVRRVMAKMGMSRKKCMNLPAKADPQLQFEFYTQELKPRLQQAANGERKVFFVDAVHFVLGSFLGLVWCFARPLVRTSPGRQRYSVLGAIESHSKELISVRTRGNVNSETVCELLEKNCEAHPTEEITLVMDNARYQHNNMVKAVAKAVGIELLFLPAYSPNLNLIERLWKLTKKRCLTNRYYENFDKFVEGIDRCLDSFATTLHDEVSSLLTLNFQFFGNRNS
jgi:transposase